MWSLDLASMNPAEPKERKVDVGGQLEVFVTDVYFLFVRLPSRSVHIMLAPVPTGFKILGGNNYSTGNTSFVLLFTQCHQTCFSYVTVNLGGLEISLRTNISEDIIFSSMTANAAELL